MLYQYLSKSIVATSLLLLLTSAASADLPSTGTFTLSNDFSGAAVATLSEDGGKTYFTSYVGRYEGQINGGPLTGIFCTDVSHESTAGQSYAVNTGYTVSDAAGAKEGSYYAGGLASAENPADFNPTGTMSYQQRADEVAFLSDSYVNATTTTFTSGLSGSTDLVDNLAGVELAIWDITQDGGNGITAGNVVGDSSTINSYGNIVEYYINQAAQNATYTSNSAVWIQAPISQDGSHAQDFTYSTDPPMVPEPSPAAATIIALALIGGGIFVKARSMRA